MASGSEVQHAMDAAAELGKGVRVVSMPSMYRFDKQADSYREEVLPSSCTKRVAMEVRACIVSRCIFHAWRYFVLYFGHFSFRRRRLLSSPPHNPPAFCIGCSADGSRAHSSFSKVSRLWRFPIVGIVRCLSFDPAPHTCLCSVVQRLRGNLLVTRFVRCSPPPLSHISNIVALVFMRPPFVRTSGGSVRPVVQVRGT